MKKILITILIILLIILAYFAMFNGLTLGSVHVLSVEQIIEQDKKLTDTIEAANSLLKKDYPSKMVSLEKAKTNLLDKKNEYFEIAKQSTEGEITKANTEETYLREYLWVRVGTHATQEGVVLKMDVKTGDAGNENIKNLAFTVQGDYAPIIEFISSLENDDKLNFKIENFKMVKGGTNLTATFNVRNVRIKSETVSANNAVTSPITENITGNTTENTTGTTEPVE